MYVRRLLKHLPLGAVMSEQGDADCTFSMCSGVKFIVRIYSIYAILADTQGKNHCSFVG